MLSNDVSVCFSRASFGQWLIADRYPGAGKKAELLEWGPHLAKSLETVERNQAWEGDALLVQLVRIHLTMEHAKSKDWRTSICQHNMTLQAPAAHFIQAFYAPFDSLFTVLEPWWSHSREYSLLISNPG